MFSMMFVPFIHFPHVVPLRNPRCTARTQPMKNTLLSIGHGYSARALARILPLDKWRIIGTVRSTDKADEIRAEGVEPLIWPDADLTSAINSATCLLTSVAPTEDGDPVINALAPQIAAAPHLRWIGYLSTTAVYGDHKGGWVDEKTPLAPTTRRGQLRVTAEAAWQDFATKQTLTLNIFRLAGIYGPGRGPFAKVRTGTARRIIKPDQVFSRIHVEDIAQALAAAIAHPTPGAIYNLCDDLAAPPEDVIAFAAKLLDAPIPPAEPWDTADMTPMARSFYAESKRVANQRIKSDLGITLKYPDYKSGLRALLKNL
jgi:nucleoside-diphosphate-sugar epimerase